MANMRRVRDRAFLRAGRHFPQVLLIDQGMSHSAVTSASAGRTGIETSQTQL